MLNTANDVAYQHTVFNALLDILSTNIYHLQGNDKQIDGYSWKHKYTETNML